MALITPWPPFSDGPRVAAARAFVRAEAGFKLPATPAEVVNMGVPTAEAEAAAETAAAALAVANAHIDHLGETASLMVERFAPDAPDAIRDHAAIRTIRWLEASEPGVRSETFAGGGGAIALTRSYIQGGALRASGAEALLARWRRHQLLVCE